MKISSTLPSLRLFYEFFSSTLCGSENCHRHRFHFEEINKNENRFEWRNESRYLHIKRHFRVKLMKSQNESVENPSTNGKGWRKSSELIQPKSSMSKIKTIFWESFLHDSALSSLLFLLSYLTLQPRPL